MQGASCAAFYVRLKGNITGRVPVSTRLSLYLVVRLQSGQRAVAV
jgi:hypothetical protein